MPLPRAQIEEAEAAMRWLASDAESVDRLANRVMLALAAATLGAMALGWL